MIRLLDLFFSIIGLVIFFPLMAVLIIAGFLDTGSPIFKQTRVGRYQRPFVLYKFRTMKIETKSVASHLANPSYITKFGRFLRATKLDELPQLINVIKGEMSLVGPRPNLTNQLELIEVREQNDIYSVRPGITGYSQIMNIDMSTPERLADCDSRMIKNMSIARYLSIIMKTITGAGRGDAISQ